MKYKLIKPLFFMAEIFRILKWNKPAKWCFKKAMMIAMSHPQHKMGTYVNNVSKMKE